MYPLPYHTYLKIKYKDKLLYKKKIPPFFTKLINILPNLTIFPNLLDIYK